ncbi:MAG: type II secretion system protein, partial [Planctomycetota bacterium]
MMHTRPHTPCRAFTLIEMLMVISIMAMTVVMVLPMVSSDTQPRLRAASVVLRSDIEMAQVLTSSNPTTPVVVHFAADGSGYHLAYRSAPKVPIVRSDTGEPYDEKIGVGRLTSAEGVTISLTDVPDGVLAFNAQNGVEDFTL